MGTGQGGREKGGEAAPHPCLSAGLPGTPQALLSTRAPEEHPTLWIW